MIPTLTIGFVRDLIVIRPQQLKSTLDTESKVW